METRRFLEKVGKSKKIANCGDFFSGSKLLVHTSARLLGICWHEMRFRTSIFESKCVCGRRFVSNSTGKLRALFSLSSCPDVRCPVCRGRLSEHFRAKKRFVDLVK